MSFASEHLSFMFWIESNNFNQKQYDRRKKNIKRNLKLNIGDKIYCPRCHKRLYKTYKEQYCCNNDKCAEKLLNIKNEIIKAMEK